MLASDAMEIEIVKVMTQQAGVPLTSREISRVGLVLALDRHAIGQVDEMTLGLVRLAIKAYPDAANAAQMIAAYREMVTDHVTETMPALPAWIADCTAKALPLPIIISCEKYLDKAKALSRTLTPHYCGVRPIIIKGAGSLRYDDAAEQILQLPVCDDYEALPHKIFETWLLFAALGARHGVLKIDDDVTIARPEPCAAEDITSFIANHNYIEEGISPSNYNRTWHGGKCATPTPPIYCKPFLGCYANWPLSYLSAKALELLSDFYLRYTGYLAGELYEEKAVGDLMLRLGIPLTDQSIAPLLGVRTDAPPRVVQAMVGA